MVLQHQIAAGVARRAGSNRQQTLALLLSLPLSSPLPSVPLTPALPSANLLQAVKRALKKQGNCESRLQLIRELIEARAATLGWMSSPAAPSAETAAAAVGLAGQQLAARATTW